MAARKDSKYPIIESLEIVDVAAEGKALARYNDMVVFVPYTVPGDIVDVQINARRRRFMEGYVVKYIKYSDDRCESFCSHYGDCGGCKWQTLPYEKQLYFKQKQVEDQLTRIGKIDMPMVDNILGSEQTKYYRNKLEFTFCDKKWIPRSEISSGKEIDMNNALGFHVSGMFDKILDITKCHLQSEPSNKLRLAIKEFTLSNNYSYYNPRTHEGFMRNIVIRTSSTSEVMLIVIFAYDDKEKIDELMSYIKDNFKEVSSLMYVINTKLNDSYSDLEVHCYSGNDYIFETMENLRFKIGAKSFYQTNSQQAYNLYKITRDFAAISKEDIVYDLYTGTGTIANFIAGQAKKVVGIEYVPEAIEDAKINSAINGIDNTVFYAGDMKDVLSESFIEENGTPDVIILDPPRAGIHEDVARTILQASAKRIVYVSCNPATQARDISIFDSMYRVVKIQPVDMFPHTHHVENVVLLEKR